MFFATNSPRVEKKPSKNLSFSAVNRRGELWLTPELGTPSDFLLPPCHVVWEPIKPAFARKVLTCYLRLKSSKNLILNLSKGSWLLKKSPLTCILAYCVAPTEVFFRWEGQQTEIANDETALCLKWALKKKKDKSSGFCLSRDFFLINKRQGPDNGKLIPRYTT